MTISKEKLIAIFSRAAWTFIQAFLAVFVANVTSGMAFGDIEWQRLFEVGVVAGLLSVAKSVLVGIPEGANDGTLHVDTSNPEKDSYLFEVDDLDNLSSKDKVTLKVTKKGDDK